MSCDVPIIVVPTIAPIFSIPNNSPRESYKPAQRGGGKLNLYSSKRGVKEIVMTIDLGDEDDQNTNEFFGQTG